MLVESKYDLPVDACFFGDETLQKYLPHHVLGWICSSPPLVALLSVACLLYAHAYTSDHVYNHSMYILFCVCTRVDIQAMCNEEYSNWLYYINFFNLNSVNLLVVT